MKKYICDTCKNPTDNIYEFDGEITGKHYKLHICDECSEEEDRFEEWTNEHYCETIVICPWCEQKQEISEAPYDEGESTYCCESCCKEFEVETRVDYSWTTRKPESAYDTTLNRKSR